MEIVITSILYIIVFIDLIPIFKKKNKRINITYILLFVLSFTIITLYYLEIPIPSPSIVVQKFIESIVK